MCGIAHSASEQIDSLNILVNVKTGFKTLCGFKFCQMHPKLYNVTTQPKLYVLKAEII